MSTAKAHGLLIEPRDVLAAAMAPLAKSDSPNGVEYIGKIEIIEVGASPVLTVLTYGGVTQVYSVAIGTVIEGIFTQITSVADIVRARVWYLSAP